MAYVELYGSIEAAYDAALDGRIPIADVRDYFGYDLSRYRSGRALESIAGHLAKLVEILGNPPILVDPSGIPGALRRDMIPDTPRKHRPGPTDQPMPPAPRCQECGGLNGKHSPNCPIGK